MYNAKGYSQSQALYTSTKHAPATVAADPAPRRRTRILHALLEALSWLGQMRATPLAGLEPESWYDKQPDRHY